MDEPLQIAEVVRQACLAAALRAYEDAGLSGLCQEGRWECAVDAIRALPLRPLLQGRSEGQGGQRKAAAEVWRASDPLRYTRLARHSAA
jgi:hypothetical protein